MKRLALVALLAWPGPLWAQDWAGLAGSWRGEGLAQVTGEQDQRLRCALRLTPDGVARAVLTGRCATTQSSRSFSLTLRDDDTGRIEAENRMEPGGDFPATLGGRLDAEGLMLEPDAQSVIALRVTDTGAVLVLGGPLPQGAGRFHAEVPLRRID
jgi:hypothetical protein